MPKIAPRILFVHNFLAPFVKMDLECLRAAYTVTELAFDSPRINPIRLWRAVSKHTFVYGWFASWHTFLPFLFARIQRKPSILIVGGYDVAKMPEISYGHMRGGLKKWISLWTMRLAKRIIAFSKSSKRETVENTGLDQKRIEVLYLGVPNKFDYPSKLSKKAMALSVGNVDEQNLLRKGHEPFVRAAAYLPEIQFVLVGKWKDDAIEHLRSIASENVTFTGWLDAIELSEYFQAASVYVQASAHEGFGLSVAEAMLAGCIPVVTRKGSLPELVGDFGFYVEDADPQAVAQIIQTALKAPKSLRQNVRQRILAEFPVEKHNQKIIKLVDELSRECVQ